MHDFIAFLVSYMFAAVCLRYQRCKIIFSNSNPKMNKTSQALLAFGHRPILQVTFKTCFFNDPLNFWHMTSFENVINDFASHFFTIQIFCFVESF